MHLRGRRCKAHSCQTSYLETGKADTSYCRHGLVCFPKKARADKWNTEERILVSFLYKKSAWALTLREIMLQRCTPKENSSTVPIEKICVKCTQNTLVYFCFWGRALHQVFCGLHSLRSEGFATVLVHLRLEPENMSRERARRKVYVFLPVYVSNY